MSQTEHGERNSEPSAVSEPVSNGERGGVLARLKERLSKTRGSLLGGLDNLLRGRKTIDTDLLGELEELLITADFGVHTVSSIMKSIENKLGRNELNDPLEVRGAIANEILNILRGSEAKLTLGEEKPFVIMVVGVNGTGKTTTIGKLASRFRSDGKRVLLAAGDTFRAAAIEQLGIWAERAHVEALKGMPGADPAAVIYDALRAATARGYEVVIADTAGRLHTKVNLMEELKKMRRVMTKQVPGAPHETLLVLDATTGQNAVTQAELFHEEIGISGIAMAKMDGTAKGGVLVAIADRYHLPIKLLGVGEGIEDLRDFDAKLFVDAIFEP